MNNSPRKFDRRKLFRVSLRSLLILTALIACVFALRSRYVASYKIQRRTAEELSLESPEISFYYRHTLPEFLGQYRPEWTLEVYRIDVSGPNVSLYASKKVFDYSDNDLKAQIDRLSIFSDVEEFRASQTELSNISLDLIVRLPSVKFIDVSDTMIAPSKIKSFRKNNPTINVIYFSN